MKSPAKNSNWHYVKIYVILTLVLVVSWVLFFAQAVQNDTVDIAAFPKEIGNWSSVEIPLTKDELAILETKNAFVRKYTNTLDKNEVYLYIVYSQNNHRVSHPPEICYTGNGMLITENIHDPIKVNYKNLNIETNRLTVAKKDYNHVVFYWFKAGSSFTNNYFKQQIIVAFNTLIGKKVSTSLIRVSSDFKEGAKDKAIGEIKSFTDLITEHLFKYLP